MEEDESVVMLGESVEVAFDAIILEAVVQSY
jgi:hypothetical protein